MEFKDHLGRPRIAITGMGMLTPIGNTVQASWHNAIEGASGLTRVTHFDPSEFPCHVGGEVKNFDPTTVIPKKEARRMGRATQFAIAATDAALKDAGLSDGFDDPERVGVMLATAIGGLDKIDNALETQRTRGWTKVNPFALTSSLPNMPAHHVSVYAKTLGPIATQVTACSAGVQAVGEGAELIRRGAADVVISGGTDALVHPGAYSGFCAMRAFPTNFNDHPIHASRPFDKNREGFVMAEGSAILILERMDHAVARGATIHAEFLGHASSSDAYHMAAPHPEAEGAIRAMKWALRDSGLDADAVGYINAHGTGTELNDLAETMAVKAVFGERAYRLPVSSTKSVMGHAMGAAGAIETVFSVHAVKTGIVPPTINLETPDPRLDLDYVPHVARETKPGIAMCNALGLGGQNASLIVRRF